MTRWCTAWRAVAVVAGVSAALAAVAPATAAGSRERSAGPAFVRVRNIPVPCNPASAAVDQRRRAVWVSCVARISERTQRVVARVRDASGVVAVDPKLGVVWAANNLGNLTEISEATNKVIHHFTGLGLVNGVAVDPRTRTVWITDDPFVEEFSEVTHRLLHTIRLNLNRLEQPWDIRVDPVAGMVWASVVPAGPQPTRTWVAQISESKHQLIHTYPYSSGTAITAPDPARGIVWMAIGNGTSPGTIEVIKEATHHVVRTITNVPVSATGMTIDSRAAAVLASGTNNRFLVIGEKTGKVIKTIRMGFFPAHPAVDQATGNVYVPIAFRGIVAQFHLKPVLS